MRACGPDCGKEVQISKDTGFPKKPVSKYRVIFLVHGLGSQFFCLTESYFVTHMYFSVAVFIGLGLCELATGHFNKISSFLGCLLLFVYLSNDFVQVTKLSKQRF